LDEVNEHRFAVTLSATDFVGSGKRPMTSHQRSRPPCPRAAAAIPGADLLR
jgi:hypothetical protein